MLVWATVVLKEVAYAFSDNDRAKIVEEVPKDMILHYESILDHVETRHADKLLRPNPAL